MKYCKFATFWQSREASYDGACAAQRWCAAQEAVPPHMVQ